MAAGTAPVVTLDGPGGAGKGTLALALAQHFGWHVLDSGAIYRALGLQAANAGWSLAVDADRAAAEAAARALAIEFSVAGAGVQVVLDGEDVTQAIRSSTVAEAASRWAAVPEIRQALLTCQRAFATAPGLIADGRDMGTVVFPDAALKFFITASVEARARRRLAQLSESPTADNIGKLYKEIEQRDARDRERETAPLTPASGSVVIDTTDQSPETSLAGLVAHIEQRGLA